MLVTLGKRTISKTIFEEESQNKLKRADEKSENGEEEPECVYFENNFHRLANIFPLMEEDVIQINNSEH